jgi:acyl carrier protein
MELHDQIRSYILTNFLFGNKDAVVSNDQSFLDNGIIDSTGVLELVTFIEENYKIRFEDDDLIPENLDSVNNIVNYITRKREPSESVAV